MSIEYETRVISKAMMAKGEPIYAEMTTTVSIDDEAGGEFIVINQPKDRMKPGEIQISPEEWPMLRALIDEMIGECRK